MVTGESASTASVHGASALGRKIMQERPGKAEGLLFAIGWSLKGHLSRDRREWGVNHVVSQESIWQEGVYMQRPRLRWAEYGGGRGWCGLGVGHGSEGVGGWVVWVLKAVIRL